MMRIWFSVHGIDCSFQAQESNQNNILLPFHKSRFFIKQGEFRINSQSINKAVEFKI